MSRLGVYIRFFLTALKMIYLKMILKKKVQFNIRSIVPLTTTISIISSGHLYIGDHINLRKGCKLLIRKNALLKIESGVSVNYNCIIAAYEKIVIGKGTIIGPNVCMYDHDHDFRVIGGVHDDLYRTAPITIGENVWIGAGCILLKGTIIGDNCVIAAGSVVRGDVPPNTIYVQKRETEILQIDKKGID
ncbi:acyltransferase [Priestia megaterium]|uniref:Acyltransferase n=1 Tax=Priestia megaterium TaxID=1404 RepID=A0A6H1NWN4_PRIMG|nr:acyltransferase [Priestia megaterium]QIZ05642.1 acyltransferase [Priestia megaterium]